jgi:hypothetical protein
MYSRIVYVIEKKCLHGSVENAETLLREEITPMMAQSPHDPFIELRTQERLADIERRTDEHLSRRAGLVALVIVLVIVIGGYILFFILH